MFACLVVVIALVVVRRFHLDHLPAAVQSDVAAAAVFDTLLRFPRQALVTTIVLGLVVAHSAPVWPARADGREIRTGRGVCERARPSGSRVAARGRVGMARATPEG
ncbi:hypothetical protein [Streptomyces sp. AC550_RSS872]|uniref:hypothetical protein n=1 Tax=Streptomyces sp. AC550_RSS872 TaxID=2823689 RepID=UPI001C25A144|nr:hypothetical protein [Streptomyces sp. AC550_RSS872]